MNAAVSRRTIRLGEVASALNAAPKNVRNWVGGGRFDLLQDEGRSPQKWRDFSFFDVAHLAIAQEAIRYGFLVDEAHDFAGATLIKVLGPLANTRTLAGMPASALVSVMHGKTLYLVKLSDGEARAIVTPGDHDDLIAIAPGCVRIHLEMVVRSAFMELTEMGHDAFESSRPREYSEEEAAEIAAQSTDQSQ